MLIADFLHSSLLDNDLYKFTMQQIAFHQFPNTEVTYGFKCRSEEDLRDTWFVNNLKEDIQNLGSLKFAKHEIEYLRSLELFQDDYLLYLSQFSLNPNHVTVDNEGEELEITIRGNWVETILWEVPLLALIQEHYQRLNVDNHYAVHYGMNKLIDNIKLVKEYPEVKFADFGTRRRYSKSWHENVVGILSSHKDIGFVGTSNVELAMRRNLKPIGTMAHEYLQACQVLAPSLNESQTFAFNMWKKEYGNKLQVALTDIFGVDAFLKDFEEDELLNHYDGVRHDSGDPFKFLRKMLDFYGSKGIDPSTKTITFSDGLTFIKMIQLWEEAKNLRYQGFDSPINVNFGIGTNLTNDVGYKPLSIVIKMMTCNGKPTAKISDSPGKVMCKDEEYILKVKRMIEEKVGSDDRGSN